MPFSAPSVDLASIPKFLIRIMLKTEFYPAPESGSPYLLLLMHGLGDSTAGYRWAPEALRLPWLNYLLVNAPDPYFGGYSWYDFGGDPGPGILRSRKLLFEVLDDARAKGFPTEKTFVFGFSQGCLMTFEAGLHYPHQFAGLVGISGYAFEPEEIMEALSPVARQQRFLITHGRFDNLIPFAEVKKQIEFLRGAGLQIEWREFDKAHTIAGEEELSVIRDFLEKCRKNA
jgi:phospholipase/carboxylesterase